MNKKHCILAASLSLVTTISSWALSQETTPRATKELFVAPNLQGEIRDDIMKLAFDKEFGEQEKPEELTWDKFFFQTLAKRNSDHIRTHQKLPTGPYARYFRDLNLQNIEIKSNIFTNDYDRNFDETDFSGANLANSTFYLASFSRSNFSDVDLTNAHWDHTNGVLTNFSRAKMINIRIYWSDFSESNLSNANLAFAILDHIVLNNALINSTNFKDAYYKTNDNNIILITLDWLKEQGAKWDEDTPPTAN